MTTAHLPADAEMLDRLTAQPFATISDMIRHHADARPDHTAIWDGERRTSYRQFDGRIDQVAAALARDSLGPGDVVAICGAMSRDYLALFLGALRAGLAVAPLAPTLIPDVLSSMIADSGAATVFADARIHALDEWLAPPGVRPPLVKVRPDDPFNLIYSSGTTGRPKGIVQPHSMRWSHVQRGAAQGYGADSITMISTPLYSNTTLVSLFPAVALGGTLVLLPRFDSDTFLALSERHAATHAMLVPVQYARLMERPDFDRFDLSSYRMKFCTSAPFSAELKAEVLARWPGGLTEYYGMTEGGGTCILHAHEHPAKLHTVGRPALGSDLRLIDDTGVELSVGAAGEVVGRSPAMMTAYHNRPADTAATEWYDQAGLRFIRTGDVGRFDADGFLTLLDRKKDVIITGGFNVFPSDLEQVLEQHTMVAEAAVFGVPSNRWGETPVAFIVLAQKGKTDETDGVLAWANQRLGKTQRLSGLKAISALPRSEIGKVLKRDLREAWTSNE